MRDSTNSWSSDGRSHLRPSEPLASKPRLGFDLEAGVSKFLEHAVAERFVLERTGRAEYSGDRGGRTAAAEHDEAVKEVAILPEPETPAGSDPSYSIPAWKRTLDLVIISLSWPFWLPLMILIIIGVKITSAGPVFYRQERVGYRGRRFMIFKFRTMKVDVDTRVHESHFERLIATDSPMTKLDVHGDPRLIKCGRFLRAAGLDELPQIFNVLRGEMSLVGARPCTVHEFERYQPWQRERVNGPPGLTGYWQVNGKNKTTFSEMIEMDIFYGKNMCVALDLSIIRRTIPAIVGQVLESRGITLWWNRSKPVKIPHLS